MPSSDFSALLAKARTHLPKIEDLKKKAGTDRHSTPVEVARAGDSLGELAEHLSKNPQDISAALPFYADCAQNDGVVSAVRALCYGNLKRHQTRWTPEIENEVGKVPPRIRSLWNSLEN